MYRTEHYQKLLKTWLAEYHKLYQNGSDDNHKLAYLKSRLGEYAIRQTTEGNRHPSVGLVQRC